jgi:hypothetical protein
VAHGGKAEQQLPVAAELLEDQRLAAVVRHQVQQMLKVQHRWLG